MVADKLGLSVPKCSILDFGDISAISVKRYDRIRKGNKLIRVHQEDLCQALAVRPESKYQSDGGPSISDAMKLLDSSSAPMTDRNRFMMAIAFNYLIVNSDAHAKNYSLLHASGGQIRLAPFYDIASLLPYVTQNKELRLAMSLGGKYRDDQISIESLRKAARIVGYPAEKFINNVLSMSNRLCDLTSDVIHTMKSRGIRNPVLDRILHCWKKRVAQINIKFGNRLTCINR